MAGILPIQRKTQDNQSINREDDIKFSYHCSIRGLFDLLCVLYHRTITAFTIFRGW